MRWDKRSDRPDFQNAFEQLVRDTDTMERSGFSEREIVAYLLEELHRRGLTMQQFDDWRHGLNNR